MRGRSFRFPATTERAASLGLLVIRVWFGTVLALGHGLGKVTDLPKFTRSVDKLGFFAPDLMALAAALSELAGGLFMAVGLFARPAAAAVLVTMLTAALYVHADDPFPKKEFALAYAAAALAVLLAGPGRYSVDARRPTSAQRH